MSTLAAMTQAKDHRRVETSYRICAEMVEFDADGTKLHKPGTMRWIGSEFIGGYPHWTSEEYATKFLTHESAATFFRYANGHSHAGSLYQPKPGTAMVIETVVTTHVASAAVALA